MYVYTTPDNISGVWYIFFCWVVPFLIGIWCTPHNNQQTHNIKRNTRDKSSRYVNYVLRIVDILLLPYEVKFKI